jgi:hypothetical protein
MMSEHIHKMLADYQKTDFNGRLNLYLQCRELRAQFMKIDQNEQMEQVDRRGGLFRNSSAAGLIALLGTSITCVRRLLASAKS